MSAVRRHRPIRGRAVLSYILRSALLALVLAFAVPTAPAADEAPLKTLPVPLDPMHPAITRLGALDYVAGFVLMPAPTLLATKPAAPWGGLSDMMLAPDGTALLSVADIGWWWRLTLTRDAQGRLTGVPTAEAAPLRDLVGAPLVKKFESDAESMTRLADGRWLVGFERDHRIWSYPGADAAVSLPEGPATSFGAPAEIRDLPENNGIEAMAELPGGRLLMLAEGEEDAPGDGKGWIGKPGAWSPVTIRRSDGFRPTALAALPSGGVLLLERYFTKANGPGARISYLPAASLAGNARLEPTLLAEWHLPLTVDNFECLAVTPAPEGGFYIFVMSDDNQNPLQRTLLLQFHWAGA